MNLKCFMMIKIHPGLSGEAGIISSHDLMVMSYCYSVAYLGPSVTPYQHNNPAYRIYEIYDDKMFQLSNHHVYFFNLTVANSESIIPTWEYLYGAKVR